MVDRVVVYRSYLLPDFDFRTEKEAKLGEIQQEIHLLSAGAKMRNYAFRTNAIRELLDKYDKIEKEE